MSKKMAVGLSIAFVIGAFFGGIYLRYSNADRQTAGNLKENIEQYTMAYNGRGELEKTAVNECRPFLKDGKRKFRIAVVQSGEYYGYVDTFRSVLAGLVFLGWMDDFKLSEEGKKSVKGILKELQSQNYSKYIEFSPQLFYDYNWDDTTLSSPEYQEIINGGRQVDLIISLGTSITKILASRRDFQIPVLGASISDPVAAGIITTPKDSGRDFLTLRCDPDVYLRQIRLFHEIVKFKRLGLLYTDTVDGRSYAALTDVEKVASEEGFTIVPFTKYLIEEDGNPDAEKNYLKALRELCPKVDAIYLTTQAGLTFKSLPQVVAIVNNHKTPTFAMDGSKYVEGGVLFGVSAEELRSSGIYDAKKIVRIFGGEKPRHLNQIFVHAPKISVNLQTSRWINFDVPVDVLMSSDEVYREITAVNY